MTYAHWEWDDVFGPKLAARKLDALDLSIRAGGFRIPLEQSVRQVIIPEIKHQFAVGGDPKWAELAESTKQRKKRNKDRILIETGTLEKAATALARWRIKNDEAIFTGLPGQAIYGNFHLVQGYHRPIRDWARWNNSAKDRIDNIFDAWVLLKIKAVFH